MNPIFEKTNLQEDQSFFIEEIKKPFFSGKLHFHPEIEIIYVREGSGIKYIGDSITPFYPGDLVIIGSNIPHLWSSDPDHLNSAANQMINVVSIKFNEDFLGKSAPEMHTILDFLHEAKRGIQFVRRTGKSLINKIEQLTTIKGMNRLIGLLSILDIMSTTGDIIYLSSPGYKPRIINSEDKERMEIIFRYVNQEYSNKIYLKKISSLVHLTSPSFCRYFKSRTNKVFSTFVNEVRINNSCKMLIQNKFTIAEVCFASGFNYLSNFNRQFRKIKGLTPSEYQSKYRNMII